jgi:hypothetical protein
MTFKKPERLQCPNCSVGRMVVDRDTEFGWCPTCKALSPIPVLTKSSSRREFGLRVASGLTTAAILYVSRKWRNHLANNGRIVALQASSKGQALASGRTILLSPAPAELGFVGYQPEISFIVAA